jgi:Cdc6-like AAA superfamily ATPase
MFEDDIFGLESEAKILRSKVREVFTPHQPILRQKLFIGRQKEVSSLITYLNTPGQHALLYGNRGVGKSSLANITSELILKQLSGGMIIKKRCDSSDTFLSIIGKVLIEVGINVEEVGIKDQTGKSFSKIVSLSSSTQSDKIGANSLANSPSWVVSKISHLSAIFVVDEFDAIKDQDDKKKIAELIKQLSDEGSKLKILLVGIASNSNELTAGHPSVSRCLKEVKLDNMTNKELEVSV